MATKITPTQPAATPYCGVFDLFKIGIGPSSSHSVGPMVAAAMFLEEITSAKLFPNVCRVRVDLYGSLALTGLGHGTDTAVLMGLSGEKPDSIDPDSVTDKLTTIRNNHEIVLAGKTKIRFEEKQDLVFNRKTFLAAHPNGIRFQAFGDNQTETPLIEATYYSVGGGFVVKEGDEHALPVDGALDAAPDVPYPFSSARELLEITDEHHFAISELARENERAFRSDEEISKRLQTIWEAMQQCVRRGCQTEGILPGGLNVERRASSLYKILCERAESMARDPLSILDWVDLYALAVNEENAAGGRVVTAPTNGAAGIIPAVLLYFDRFCHGAGTNSRASADQVERFLLTAAVIGALYKKNASISGAEVGCQGEVGVACSMAAGALTEVLGGTPHQVEEAAEIGMEHNLGLTCDPIKGLVQVPCIERNAMGAVKAINASRLALRRTGKHFVSLDRVIRVMKRTGADMSSRYKETSRGGLAVNITEC